MIFVVILKMRVCSSDNINIITMLINSPLVENDLKPLKKAPKLQHFVNLVDQLHSDAKIDRFAFLALQTVVCRGDRERMAPIIAELATLPTDGSADRTEFKLTKCAKFHSVLSY